MTRQTLQVRLCLLGVVCSVWLLPPSSARAFTSFLSDSSSPASSSSSQSSAASACSLSFDTAVLALPGDPPVALRWYCPPGCLTAAANSASVIGSFPYHGASSLCLSAIHCGLLNSSAGGAVWFHPFYSESWDEWRLQLYPHSAWRGSLSHGVQSLPVPQPAEPLTLDSHSFVLHSRGAVFNQRRQAPWPARAGHAHIAHGRHFDDHWRYRWGFHVIIGGRNATHYMNDVWLYSLRADDTDRVAANGRWFRLPDAPFSPRAHTQYTSDVVDGFLAATGCFVNSSATTHDCRLVVSIIGGETAYSCGRPELGRCVSELWRLSIRGNASSPSFFTLTWDPEPVQLPIFPPRCGSLLLSDWQDDQSVPGRPLVPVNALLGGQLSYEDESCLSPPVTVNDVFYSRDRDWPFSSGGWVLESQAPWSPRRSLLSLPQFITRSGFQVGGGITYHSLRRDAASNTTLLTAAEMFADLWLCTFVSNSTHGLSCDWTPAESAPNCSSDAWAPVGSLPAPLAYLPRSFSSGRVSAGAGIGVLLGGVSSREAQQRWAAINTSADSGVRATLIEQPLLVQVGLPSTTLQDVLASRYQLPLSYHLTDDELNDGSAPFIAAAAGLVTTNVMQNDAVAPSFATAHRLSSQQFDNALFLWSAESAGNSSRGQLDFVFSRHSYGAGMSNLCLHGAAQVLCLSGGVDGSVFSSEWLEMQQLGLGYRAGTYLTGCFHPEDASYCSALGRGYVTSPGFQHAGHEADTFVPSSRLKWQCDTGHHFEPAALSAETSISCLSDGLWHDVELHGLRRCVADRSTCRFPEVDVGYGACGEPLPFISSIRAGSVSAHSLNWDMDCTQRDAVTLSECPGSELELEVVGGWFTLPLDIWVAGHQCLFPQLRLDNGSNSNSSLLCLSSAHSNSSCGLYANIAVCQLPQLSGFELPLLMLSGSNRRQAQVRMPDSPSGPSSTRTASLSYSLPFITALSSADCVVSRTGLQLLDCPYDRAFRFQVNGSSLKAVSELTPLNLSTSTRIYLSALSPLHCTFVRGYWAWHSTQMSCVDVPPGAGQQLPVFMSVQGLGDNSHQFTGAAEKRPTLSYRQCPAGSYAAKDEALPACRLCPAGSSTEGLAGGTRDDCKECAAGRYNNGTGHGYCELCPAGSWSSSGSGNCSSCSLNSYSPAAGLSACDSCALNQYLHIDPGDAGFTQCLPCIEFATCWPNGSITSDAGAFILIDASTAVITAASCHSSACLDAAALLSSGIDPSTPRIPLSRLPVLNRCGPGRLPAEMNLLCASCLAGYTEWNGQCLQCSGVDVLGLSTLCLVSLLLLYCLHRLPSSVESSWLSMLIFYLQLALLFATHNTVPQWLSVLNLDLLGDFHTPSNDATLGADSGAAWCIAQLSAWDKIGLHLVMPLLALAGLVLVFLFERCMQTALFRRSDAQRQPQPHALPLPQPLPQPRFRCSVQLYRALFSKIDEDLEQDWITSGGAVDGSVGFKAQAADGRRVLALRADGSALSHHPLLVSGDKQTEAGTAERSCHETEAVRKGPQDAAGSAPPAARSLCGVGLLAYNRTLLRLLLYSYNNLSLAILSYLHCQPLGAGRGSRMYSEPSVDCTSARYRALLPAFIAGLLLVVLGMPVALFCLLLRHRIAAARQRRLAATLSEDERAEQALQQRVLHARYGLLYAAYRSSCWYWSCVLLLERAVLILVFVFLPAPASFVWLTALNVGILTTHLTLAPYRTRINNRLESGVLTVLALQTAMLSLYPPSRLSSALLTAITAFVVVPALLLRLVLWLAHRPAVQQALASSGLMDAVQHWSRMPMCSALASWCRRTLSLSHDREDADEQL